MFDIRSSIMHGDFNEILNDPRVSNVQKYIETIINGGLEAAELGRFDESNDCLEEALDTQFTHRYPRDLQNHLRLKIEKVLVDTYTKAMEEMPTSAYVWSNSAQRSCIYNVWDWKDRGGFPSRADDQSTEREIVGSQAPRITSSGKPGGEAA